MCEEKELLFFFKPKLVVGIIDGENFCGTFYPSSKETVEQVAKSKGLKVKPFGVRILQVDPETKVVKEWIKIEGFSLWGTPNDETLYDSFTILPTEKGV